MAVSEGALDGVVRAFLFDLDGTLVDTRAANRAAYQEAMAAAGHPLSDEEFEATWGRDSRDFIPDLVPGVSAREVDAIRAHKTRAYARLLHLTRLNTDLVGFLRMVSAGAATALVTTAKTTNGRQVLDVHGLAPLFDVCVFGDEVERGKPDPHAYEVALERLGVPAGAALAFEDSETGVAAALAAGIRVVPVPRF